MVEGSCAERYPRRFGWDESARISVFWNSARRTRQKSRAGRIDNITDVRIRERDEFVRAEWEETGTLQEIHARTARLSASSRKLLRKRHHAGMPKPRSANRLRTIQSVR